MLARGALGHLQRVPWRAAQARRYVPAAIAGIYRYAHSRSQLLVVSDEVGQAVSEEQPVVALESTIYTHGAMGSELGLEDLVREHGAVPATVGVVDGVPTVGLTREEVARMVANSPAKVSRRDIARLAGMGILGQQPNGGTTVAATMLLARLAGIRIFGTGGLGGVHRGFETAMDVSADLTELGRTRVAVVASGCKGFLDVPRTLEYLETHGVAVATFLDGRDPSAGNIEFPAFWSRDSGVASPSFVADERQAAAMVLAQERLGIESGILFANPIPLEHEIPVAEMRAVIEQAVAEAAKGGFTGSRNTPYILGRIKELTMGRSIPANKELVRANVIRAARIAMELSRLIAKPSGFVPSAATLGGSRPDLTAMGSGPVSRPTGSNTNLSQASKRSSIFVAGSVAVDLSCDYLAPSTASATIQAQPALHTSNPSVISQSIGGVGRNVAMAAHLVANEEVDVKLCSLVGNDLPGATILAALESAGLDTTQVRTLDSTEHPGARTAQYVAVNGSDRNLVLAMADMAIFSDAPSPTLPPPSSHWSSALAAAKPAWLVVDANWSARDIQAWAAAGREAGSHVAFEPVSTAKSTRLFPHFKANSPPPLGVFPSATVDLATPNALELGAMHAAAKERGYLDGPEWFAVLDAFGLDGSARDTFVALTSADIADAGLPVQMMQLLPYIPTIVTKLGSRGVLYGTVLAVGDPRLEDPRERRYIVGRGGAGAGVVGGVYLRMYPAAETVRDIVSVNGVGDTFLGVLVAGLAQGGSIQGLIDVAQRAAAMTLQSSEAVSEKLPELKEEIRKICRI